MTYLAEGHIENRDVPMMIASLHHGIMQVVRSAQSHVIATTFPSGNIANEVIPKPISPFLLNLLHQFLDTFTPLLRTVTYDH